MKAICYDKTGPAADVLTLRDLPDPVPQAGEVLVEIAVSAVHPSDVKTRAGARGKLAFDRIIPHSDGAGRVVSVGAGVDPGRIGERVWLWNAAWQRADGTAAERVALPSEQAVPLPDRTDYDSGACLGIPAITAHRCLFADGPVTGQSVLVTGGAGTVGSYAIQMAKLGGAHVIATISGPEKAEHAVAMGADATVNYRDESAAAKIVAANGGAQVDRIVEVEFGGNLATTTEVLAANGTVAAYGSMAIPEPALPFYQMMFKGQSLRTVLAYTIPHEARAQANADIIGWLRDGALKHPVAAVFPIDRAADAHRSVEAGTRIGVTLLRIADIT